MQSNQYHIAQINIARGKGAIDDPLMADFVRQIDEVNLLAEHSPGFIWRLKGEDGASSSYISVVDDPKMLVNMSVWETIENLKEYVYRTHHAKVYSRRKEWFEMPDKSPLAMWWIPAGEIPTLAEGLRRLEILWNAGATPEEFTFKQQFPAPLSKHHTS